MLCNIRRNWPLPSNWRTSARLVSTLYRRRPELHFCTWRPLPNWNKPRKFRYFGFNSRNLIDFGIFFRFFLVNHKADVNALNRQGESPLHIASRSGMSAVVRKLLDNGSDPNLQTPPPSSHSIQSAQIADESGNPFGDEEEEEEEIADVGLHSSMHLAVYGGFEDVVTAFVEHAE